MEENSKIRTTELSCFPENQWAGVPSICDLGGHRIGALYPSIENDITEVTLSVFNW